LTPAATIEWVTTQDRFEALAEEWNALLGEDSMPFDCHEWYAAWWRAFGTGSELRICLARRGDDLVAVLPLRTVSGGLAALANVHTPVFRPLATDAEALEAVLAAAFGDGSHGLELFALPTADRALTVAESQAKQLGTPQLAEPIHVSPIVDTSGDFDEWRVASKPRWGAPIERFRRKMSRDHDAHLTIVEIPDDLDRELDRGFAVEGSGWKARNGTAITSSPDTAQFYREIAHAFAGRGELRLSGIELDGDLAAFDLTLLHRNQLYLLKTGFDERFRKLAPGLVMRLSIVERCFELGLDAHDLLGDDSEWKRKFATTARPHTSFRAFGRGPAGRGRYAYRAHGRPLLKRARDKARAIQPRLSQG
jgi:CelD/BcsL family acetyltransferase involved in cellulose biosynthesis